MSSNPFRRSRAPGNATAEDTILSQSHVEPGPGGRGSRPIDLTVNAKVPPAADRHVSFASPPVDSTISAISYPSSPEDARSSPVFQFTTPHTQTTPNYRAAIHSDPFWEHDLAGPGDKAIEEALDNAQQNSRASASTRNRSDLDAVQNTLSRFAPGPRQTTHDVANTTPNPPSNARQTMDVEAFKRLLLTGEAGQAHEDVPKPGQSDHQVTTGTSTAHSASITNTILNDARPKPTAPPPRRAKSVKTKALSEQSSANPTPPSQSDTEKTTESPPVTDVGVIKRPPPPPVTRRQSQRTPSYRSDRQSLAEIEAESSDTASIASSSKIPPAPPSRRQKPTAARRTSSDLAPSIEEPAELYKSQSGVAKPAAPQPPPPPPPTRNPSKRASMGLMTPPSVPPPRRGRGSSRSSVDSFRPSLSSIVGDDHTPDPSPGNAESYQPVSRAHPAENASNAPSILAELETLQRELDAARSRTWLPPPN